jgi:hypothetical protein
MRRRQLVIGCGTAVTATLTGCLGSGSSPKDVVRSFLNTLYEGQEGGTAEELNTFLHPNTEVARFTGEALGRFDGKSVEINSLEVESKDGSTAKVRSTVTINTGTRMIDDTALYELRKANGKWKIYHIDPQVFEMCINNWRAAPIFRQLTTEMLSIWFLFSRATN